MKAEKGEHERAPSVGESYLTPLRATLRAPPSKWAIKGFFPRRVSEANRGRGQPRRGYRRPKPATRSGAGRKSCRAAGFLLHTFLSPPKEKCERPLGRPVPIRAGVGASGPAKGELLTAKLSIIAASRVAFRSPPCTPFGSPPKAIERPMGRQVPIRAVVGASGPLAGIFYNKVGLHHCLQGAFRSPPAPLRFACRNKDPHKAANPALRRGRPIPYWGR